MYAQNLAEQYREIELIVGCGDLPADYLQLFLDQLHVPLVYVSGNHDPDRHVIPGGVNMDGKLTRIRGRWICGLGGSRRYKFTGKHQYSERQMRLRILRLLPRLYLNRARCGRGMDMLVTHASPHGIHDQPDPAHAGFRAFNALIHRFHPSLMIHGHIHARRNLDPTVTELEGCRVVNVYPLRVLELEDVLVGETMHSETRMRRDRLVDEL
jgi:Icc-related predicted phosphoesterase